MLSDVYFPRINGVSTSIQTFRRELAKLSCRTLLVAPRYPQAFDDDGDVTRVDAWTVPFDPEDRLMRPRRLRASCRALAGQFDLIHIQTPFLAHRTGVKLARELGVKVIETYHTYFEEYFHHYMPFMPRGALRPIARAVSKAQCNAVDAVISPSAPMANVLREYGVTAPLEIIGTGLELDIFRRGDGARFRSTHRIPPERPLVLHVGRVAFEKNIEFLIDAFVEVRRQVPDALFVVAGDGPALGSLRGRTEKHGIDDSVMFIGYLEREKSLLDCYKSADVFTFASRTETQGLVLLEAMASGTPVVSTAVLGTKDLLEHGEAGAIVAPEERQPFADAVVRVLRDETLRKRLGDIGQRFVATHWSSAATAEKLLELYCAVWKQARSAPASP
jgi:glycosyltransferase involved in cell wall biosynthesis